MKSVVVTLLIEVIVCYTVATANNEREEIRYEADWNNLDTRPLPTWYDEAKFGIMIHWGVFSVPSLFSEWFWYRWQNDGEQRYIDFMEKNYPPDFSYQEFAKDLTAELFNATEWAELFVKSGAKYVVLTSKHHEGYTLWPSKYAYSWNSQDVGPKKDIVGELADAVRKENLTFGLYHSLFEWFHPQYISDVASNFTQQEFALNKIMPELKELVETYKPAILWSDGDSGTQDTYWNSSIFVAWLYNDSPVKDYVVTNDRWGHNIKCHHGGFLTCSDGYNPGKLLDKKWENAMTIDTKSWGFRRNAKLSEYHTIEELIVQLASTVSCGGNIMMNVGPTKDGIIDPIEEERLTQVGQWLAINGEAIYATKPWTYQKDNTTSDVWYTSKNETVYAIVVKWDWHEYTIVLNSPIDLFQDEETTVTLLGNEENNLLWRVEDGLVYITFPNKATVKSEWAWVLKIQPNTK